MLRNIVNIDQEKCNGCGLCVNACHERAIILNDQGKAELIKDDYCDGLGDCLPACPMNAISIEQRETVPYDEAAVLARIAKMEEEAAQAENMEEIGVKESVDKKGLLGRLMRSAERTEGSESAGRGEGNEQAGMMDRPVGCPGAMARALNGANKPIGSNVGGSNASVDNSPGCGCDIGRDSASDIGRDSGCDGGSNKGVCGCSGNQNDKSGGCGCDNNEVEFSQLSHWPVQIRLAASKAEFFEGADLLVAADCSAYAYGNFHNKFMKDRVTLVGCPKLDDFDYEEKFYEIFMNNNVRSVTLVRMEVPCCGGMERAVLNALDRTGKLIPKQVVVLSLGGEILSR